MFNNKKKKETCIHAERVAYPVLNRQSSIPT